MDINSPLQKNAIRLSIAGVIALLGYGIYRNFFSQSFDPNNIDPSLPEPGIDAINASNRADNIHSAVKGFGTSESLVLDQFSGNLTQNDYVLIQQEYGIRDGSDLTNVLLSELSNNDIEDIQWLVGRTSVGNRDLSLILAETEVLYDAMKGLGTDEATIFETLEPYHVFDFDQVSNIFGIRDNKNFVQWLRSELNNNEINLLSRKFPNRI